MLGLLRGSPHYPGEQGEVSRLPPLDTPSQHSSLPCTHSVLSHSPASEDLPDSMVRKEGPRAMGGGEKGMWMGGSSSPEHRLCPSRTVLALMSCGLQHPKGEQAGPPPPSVELCVRWPANPVGCQLNMEPWSSMKLSLPTCPGNT